MKYNPCRANLKAVLTMLERANILEQYSYKSDITRRDKEALKVHEDYFEQAFKELEKADVVPEKTRNEFEGKVRTALETFDREVTSRIDKKAVIIGDTAEHALASIRSNGEEFLFNSLGWCFKRE